MRELVAEILTTPGVVAEEAAAPGATILF